jgi:hypothetical protein
MPVPDLPAPNLLSAELLSFDPREIALRLALEFHRGAMTDDPRTALSTAQDFLGFLAPESSGS